MDKVEREQATAVLHQISAEEWGNFWRTTPGQRLNRQYEIARESLRHANHGRRGSSGKQIDVALDLLGDRLLSDPEAGPGIRELLLRAVSSAQWEPLKEAYPVLAGARAQKLHGNMTRHGMGSSVMAQYWRQGGKWARTFCDITGMPRCFAESRQGVLPGDEEVVSVEPLHPLHDFQLDVYKKLRKLLDKGSGAAGLLSLPTGAGKTRVVIEAIVDHIALASGHRNIVIWIAQSDELLRQAWECFREVWQTPPRRHDGVKVPRRGVMKIVRAWGSRKSDEIEISGEPTVIVAGIQQLASWLENGRGFFDDFQYDRLAAVVVDEAHRIIAGQHRDVLVELRVRDVNRWRVSQTSAPLIGLTATPWRTIERENAPLQRLFASRLLTPKALERSPIGELQRRGILADMRSERLDSPQSPAMTSKQLVSFEQFRELPADYLSDLGDSAQRNGKILSRLLALPANASTLVFTCSVEHASILTLALNRAFNDTVAAMVTGSTPRSERFDAIEDFREGRLRFLCNFGVLTTGFDAPKINVVCVTRPTTSALLYEQMVGRGLRGPKNGGTESCLVIDVQDGGLPDSVMSYARVAEEWGARR